MRSVIRPRSRLIWLRPVSLNGLTGRIATSGAIRFQLRRLGISLDAGSAMREVATFQSESIDCCLRKPAPRFDLLIRSHHCTDNRLGRLRILFGDEVDRANGRTAL